MSSTPSIEVCLSPDLLHLYELEEKTAVVVDILRATSCIVTGLAHHVLSITPITTLDECRQLMREGYVGAAERNGEKVEGFELDNSPFSYMHEALRGKNIAMTTTNGTLAFNKSRKAGQVIAGAFLNISALASYLNSAKNNVIIVCGGWKGKFNLEDTLFSGALIYRLRDSFDFEDDASLAAMQIYTSFKDDLLKIIRRSSHYRRLKRLNIEKDIHFCLESDRYEVIPVLRGNELRKAR